MDERTSSTGAWNCCSGTFRKDQIAYICQVTILYIIIITALINLSIGNGDKTLFSTLLTSCIGYLLPNPSIKRLSTNQGTLGIP